MKSIEVVGTKWTAVIVFALVIWLMSIVADSVQAQDTAIDDYGDAPASYGDVFQESSPLIRLGSCTDAEMGSINSANALGDDLDNGCADDATTFSQGHFAEPGAVITSVITYTQNGHNDSFVSLWIDFDGDGNFSDFAGDFSERMGESGPIDKAPGDRTVQFTYTVPANATPIYSGRCYARVIIRSDKDLDPTGKTSDLGEIEDYAFDCAEQLAVSMSNIVTDSVNINSRLYVVMTLALALLSFTVVRLNQSKH